MMIFNFITLTDVGCSELDQIQDFIHGNLNEFTGPNFTKALRDVQLVESDVSVLGLPSPLLPTGSVYSVALAMSFAASSWCGQCGAIIESKELGVWASFGRVPEKG